MMLRMFSTIIKTIVTEWLIGDLKKLLIETFMAEVQPVVLEEVDFEYEKTS